MAWRIAGGRRRYNAQRRRARDERRARVKAALLATERPCVAALGAATRLARQFGVHHSTMVRDLEAITPTLVLPDPCCALHAALDADLDRRRGAYTSTFGFKPTLEQFKRYLRW